LHVDILLFNTHGEAVIFRYGFIYFLRSFCVVAVLVLFVNYPRIVQRLNCILYQYI